jgi:hypothetical protein
MDFLLEVSPEGSILRIEAATGQNHDFEQITTICKL